MNEWKEYKLGEIADVQNGYAFKSSEFAEKGVPIIKIKNIVPPRVSLDEVQFYNNEISTKLEKFLVMKKDFLISMTGSTVNQMASAVGKMARFQFDIPSLMNQRVAKIYSISDNVKDDYLFYYLNRFDVQYELASMASGSANQANISPEQLKSYLIKVPNIETQKSITEILSSLDDKIELNNKINQGLESLAQLLFKRWFVDFEFPNENGEPYKSSGGEMIDSELGEIPKGWEATKLGDIISHETLKVKKVKKTVTNVYSAVKTSQLVLSDEYFNKQVYSKSIENYYVVEPYWFAYNPSRINIGSIGLNKGTTGAVSPVYVVFSVKQNSHFILENYFKLSNIKKQIIQKCSGTVRQSLNFESLSTFPFLKSPDDIINRFNEYINMYYNVSKRLIKENDSLIKLREELLPKLISGELQINEN